MPVSKPQVQITNKQAHADMIIPTKKVVTTVPAITK